MISVIGLGTGASSIANLFKEHSQYSVHCLDDKVKRTSKYKFRLKAAETPEECENNIPDLSGFFENVEDHVQFFVIGSTMSSNYSLGVLEQLRGKKVDLFYIKPDTELLSGLARLMENTVFGVLQQYARSGLLNSITLISNLKIEETLQNIPVKQYYKSLNSLIQSSVHYMNYFDHNEPELGVTTTPSETCRIRTMGMVDMQKLQEKWFFELDIPREVCYYLCINEERLTKDGSLHKQYVDILKEKPRNAFRNVSYAIYETPAGRDFGFCVARTNAIQENT